MDMKSNEDRCTTTKLLQESIIQLCKVTAGLSGNLVVDGIVCICSDDEPHQIVVKIHERLQLGVSDGFDKAIACDSNRKRGHADNALLVGTESQGKDSLRREEVNSNAGDKRHSVKEAPGRGKGGKHYECGICLAKFVAKQQLVNHELKLHCKLMSHYCHACQMGFTDGMSYVRHRYSSCHRTRLRQQRRSIASNQQRPRSVHPQFGSATSCRNLRKSDTEDLSSISRPTPTPVSNEPNTATTAADGLSNTKDILPLAAGEYVICINEPDDKLQDDSRILDSVQQHPVTSGVVCKQNGSVNNIVILHKGNLASMKRSTVPLPLVKIDTKKPMLIECQDQTAGDVNAKDNDVISPSSRSNQEPPAVGKADVSTEEQFLCEFCQQNLGTFDKYVCHVEKIHKWYPCHCCSRMFKDVFERRSHTHVEHQLPAIYCNVCHSDFFDRDMYIGHIQHCHAITDTQDGGRWYVEENSSRLLHTQSEGQVNFPLSSTQHTQSATSRVTDSVSDNAQTNEATQYKTESKIKVYDISDDESLPTVEDNDRQEHLQNPTGAAVNPPQIPPHPDRTYVCSMCSDVLCGVAAFEQHCMTAHGRYGCMYCEKLFTQKGNMRRHQLTHTGEKPYRCIVCGVAFKRKEQLTSHELSSHNIVVRSQFYTLS